MRFLTFKYSAYFHGFSVALILAAYVLLAFVGVFSLYEYNALPAGGVLEVAVLASALFLIRKTKREFFLFSLVSLLYVLVCYFIAKSRFSTNDLDFLQAFKAFIYVGTLGFFVGKGLIERNGIAWLYKFSVYAFLFKYGYSVLLDFTPRMGSRPGLFVENNFELIFLIVIYYLLHRVGKATLTDFMLLALVVLVSGSRSAALALCVVFACANFSKLNLKFVLASLVMPLVLLLAYNVFLSRMDGGLEAVDRYRFFLVFLSEVSDWSWYDFLFGNMPLTPLAPSSCKTLSFYDALFSYSGDGSCYSVVLHSYLLRVVLDHGLLGLMFLMVFIYRAMARVGYSSLDAVCVLGVFLASGLSVSSFNSVFCALALIFVFSINREALEVGFNFRNS